MKKSFSPVLPGAPNGAPLGFLWFHTVLLPLLMHPGNEGDVSIFFQPVDLVI